MSAVGGVSARQVASLPTPGEPTSERWIDGGIKSERPTSRGYVPYGGGEATEAKNPNLWPGAIIGAFVGGALLMGAAAAVSGGYGAGSMGHMADEASAMFLSVVGLVGGAIGGATIQHKFMKPAPATLVEADDAAFFSDASHAEHADEAKRRFGIDASRSVDAVTDAVIGALDRDGDGRLSTTAESSSVVSDTHERDVSEFLTQADTNRNGSASRAELREAVAGIAATEFESLGKDVTFDGWVNDVELRGIVGSLRVRDDG